MRKQILATIALVLLVVTAGCVGGSTALAAPGSSDSTDSRTVTVSATGEASATADIATIHVSVEAEAADANTARGQVADDAEAVRQALLDAGVSDDDIQTTQYAIHPQYDRNSDGKPTVTSYRAIHAYEVTVQNPDDAGSMIDTAVQAGADRVNSVRFGLSESAREELREQAIEDAMGNARSDAQAVATAGDVSLGPVHSASVSSQPQYFGGVEYALSAGDAAGGSTQLDSGPVSVTVQVTVRYQIA